MLNLLAIADALKLIAAGITGVKQSLLGVNQSFPTTPAVEIIVADGSLQTLAAGNAQSLAVARFQVVFYVAMTANLEDDERELIPLVESFVDTLHDVAFDFTLGGLVEDCRSSRFDFDLVKRSSRMYRYAAVEVWAGELDDSV